MESPEAREERRKAAQAARRSRYRFRDQLRPLTSLDRVRRCGRDVVSDGGVTLGVRMNPDGTRHAAYGGVATCGSVWSCPQCAAKIATRRADDLSDVIRAVDGLGGSTFMATLTMRHTSKDRLGWTRDQRRRAAGLTTRLTDHRRRVEAGHEASGEAEQALADRAALDQLLVERGVWDAVSDGWAAVTSGRRWVADQELHGGLLGWVKVVEVTSGANGWHCHVHALLSFAGQATEDDLRPLVARMFHRWRRALEKSGHDASGDVAADGRIPGWDVRRADLHDNAIAAYFTKLAHEVTSGHRKESRRPGGRTPFMLGRDAIETYSVPDVARWHEWEQASDGRRQMTWSTGRRDLRQLAHLGPERTDEEVAAEELEPDARLGLPPATFGWLRAEDHVTTVIDVGEDHGIPGVIEWLAAHDLEVVTGAGLEWIERPPDDGVTPIDRDEGTGRGWLMSTPAVLRQHRGDGTPVRRPSDRPPRWTDDARAVLATPQETAP